MKSLYAISRPFRQQSTSPSPPPEPSTQDRRGEPNYIPTSGPPRLDLQLGSASDFSLGDLEISSFNQPASTLGSPIEVSTPGPSGPSSSTPIPEPSSHNSAPVPLSGLPGPSRPNLRSEPSEVSEAALHLPALTPSEARRESIPPTSEADPNLSPFPPPSTVHIGPETSNPPSSSTQRQGLQHSLSITSSPPDYSTLSPISDAPFASYHRASSSSPSSSLNPRAVSTRNKEKQALRDTWAKQDAERQAYGEFYPFPVPHTSTHGAPPLAENTIQGFEPDPEESASSGSGTQERRQSSSIGGAGESLNVLPVGMDIRDALAKCKDPGLGWSLQFWVTIADPQTKNVFFACPASGQCSWDPPIGAMIVPRMPEGEWWELADATRGNRCYYYNTLTGNTQWTRPKGSAFVIPLGLIQRQALPKTPTVNSPNSQSSDFLSPTRTPISPPVTPNRQPLIPKRTSSSPNPSPAKSISPRRQIGQSPPARLSPLNPGDSAMSAPNSSRERDFPSEPSQSTVASDAVLRTPLSVVDEGSGKETDISDSGSPARRDKRKSRGVRSISVAKAEGRNIGNLAEVDSDDLPEVNEKDLSLRPANGTILPKHEIAEPIPVFSVRTKRMSTGLHPLLPVSISDEIQAFQTGDFAAKYFATKRTGMLRARVPFDEIMQWQKPPITSPLLVISRSLAKDAITTFKVIQHVMGERDKPVDQAKPNSSTATALNSAAKSKSKKDGAYALKLPNFSAVKLNGSRVNLSQGDGSNGVAGLGRADGVDNKVVVLEEIRWMLQLAVGAGEMRDEVYSQLIKQLTRNPNNNAMVMGFQLFCILVNSFGPSKNFEAFVKRFLENDSRGTDGISRMAQYCLGRLDHTSGRGGRGRALTIGEIEHAADAAFYPSVYGEPLDQIMSLQASTYPDLKVPVILPFLADGILALGGLKAEGIFRVPGDGDSVSELRSRMDRGHYVLTGIEDPHVAASLFKLWLRDLREPVIPEDLYNDALVASKTAAASLAFVGRLPVLNRRVLLFVISFFQLFLDEEVVGITKMTPNNLALVLAPNILRTTSDHLVTVFTNSSFESRFILQLLEHLDPQTVDPDYAPSHGR